jgi:hypothetical protein
LHEEIEAQGGQYPQQAVQLGPLLPSLDFPQQAWGYHRHPSELLLRESQIGASFAYLGSEITGALNSVFAHPVREDTNQISSKISLIFPNGQICPILGLF